MSGRRFTNAHGAVRHAATRLVALILCLGCSHAGSVMFQYVADEYVLVTIDGQPPPVRIALTDKLLGAIARIHPNGTYAVAHLDSVSFGGVSSLMALKDSGQWSMKGATIVYHDKFGVHEGTFTGRSLTYPYANAMLELRR